MPGKAYQGREIYGENRDFKSGKLGNQWRRDQARPRGNGRLRGDWVGGFAGDFEGAQS